MLFAKKVNFTDINVSCLAGWIVERGGRGDPAVVCDDIRFGNCKLRLFSS